jgi:ATP-dependent Lon protease
MADAPPDAEPTLPAELPVIPVRSSVVFPMSVHPLVIANPLAIDSVNRALAADRQVALIFQDGESAEAPDAELARIGTAGVIRQMARGQSGLQVLVEGVSRIRVEELVREGPQLRARVSPHPDRDERSVEVDAHVRRLREMVDRAFALSTGLPQELRAILGQIDEPLRLCYLLASLIEMKPKDKQLLLEQDDITMKLGSVASALGREIELLEIKGQIESKAQQEMSDSQRQYFLRQQLKAIQSELGESEGQDTQELRRRVEEAQLPEAVNTVVLRELDRFERMTQASPEAQMVRTYIEWVLDVPWSKTTEDRLDPAEARRVLDADHYDLDKVKERIVEYLAVRKLKGDMKGPILCFVGPPGVGKTSLGQSIARAMNRQFVRISLGGVRDEAEIRGHRRTYIGSMPGRIVQALKQAGSANPVFMLDEIDKLSAGFQGDPSAALLEVLDPAQNHAFRDHYLEAPFDLSRVLFIATANQLGTVHPALLDRMEIIALSGYTEEEKVHIARRYLLPRQLAEHGLSAQALELTDKALRRVIAEYTREAGVRNLERQLGAIARKVAARVAGGLPSSLPTPPPTTAAPPSLDERMTAGIASGVSASAPVRTEGAPPGTEGGGVQVGGPVPVHEETPRAGVTAPVVETVIIDADGLVPYLGRPRFRKEAVFRTSRPGVATGVAWTEVGGDVLFVEASVLPSGQGQIVLTGQLGSVMQESARAAVSHIRAQAAALGVSPGFLEHHDLHVHVPAGAIPKDGPSAGVTMATAIVSALRRTPVREDVAMTGEITLSGLVLPVGGIREKALAARRFGLKTFVLPAENRYDLEDLPRELLDDMTFVPVATLEEVLKAAMPSVADTASVDLP